MAVWFRRMLHQGQIQAHILLWQIVYLKKKNLCFPKDVEGVVVVVSEISSSVAIPLPAHVLQGCSGGLLLGFLPAFSFYSQL